MGAGAQVDTSTWPALVERHHELQQLGAALEAAVQGRGGAVLVSGGPGIGKTTLLRHLLSRAEACTVLRARCSDLEQGFGLGVVRQLVEPVLRRATPGQRASWLQGPAAEVEAILEGRGPGSLFGVLHALHWFVVNLADDGPVLVVVDDLQWCDDQSARFLDYLVARIDGVAVLVAGATRPGDHLAGRSWERAAAFTRLDPGALSRQGTAALLAESWECSLTDAFVDACHAATGGVPFHLRALALELHRDGRRPDDRTADEVAGVAPDEIVRRILVRGQEQDRREALAVARALSVLEGDPPIGVVAAVAGLTSRRTADVCRDLRAEGLLAPSRLGLVHPIVATSALDGVGPEDLEQWHGRAARAWAAAGAEAETVASHLLLGPVEPDAWAVQVLVSAADAASARLAHHQAVRHLRRARVLAGDAAGHAAVDLTARLGRAELAAGDPAACDTLRAAADLSEGMPGWSAVVRDLARALAFSGLVDEAADVVGSAAGREIDEVQGTELRVDQYLYLIVSDRTAGAVDLGARVLADADRLRLPSRGTVRGAMALHGLHRNAPAEEMASLARDGWAVGSREGMDLHRMADLVMSLVLTGDLATARSAGAEVMRVARHRGDQAGLAIAHHLRALLGFHEGALLDAEADAREALRHAGEALPLAVPVVWALHAEVLLERHGAAVAESLVAGAPRLSEGDVSGPADHVRLARGRLACEQGDWAGALGWLTGVAEGLAQREGAGLAQLPWRPWAVRAVVESGRWQQARAWSAELLDLAREHGAPLPLAKAWRTAALVSARSRPGRGEPTSTGAGIRQHAPERVRLLREAWRTIRDTGHQLERARTATLLGVALRENGEPDQARELLEVGLDGADRCGAEALRASAVAELWSLGARPRRHRLDGPSSLTASELRVARLAAAGLGNREVAVELFVTVKTVEVHLTKVYRKLGVTGRGALAAALAPAQGDED